MSNNPGKPFRYVTPTTAKLEQSRSELVELRNMTPCGDENVDNALNADLDDAISQLDDAIKQQQPSISVKNTHTDPEVVFKDLPPIKYEIPDTPDIRMTRVIKMNSVYLFINQVLQSVDDPSARINATELYKSCWSFCREHDLPKPTRQNLSKSLVSLGYERVHIHGRVFYRGIKYRGDPSEYRARTRSHWRLVRMMERNDVPQLMTITEFVRMFRISRSTWYRLVKRGEAPATIKIGRRTMIPLHAADHWANTRGIVLRDH